MEIFRFVWKDEHGRGEKGGKMVRRLGRWMEFGGKEGGRMSFDCES